MHEIRSTLRRALAVLSAGVCIVSLGSAPAGAVTTVIPVTTTDDEVNADGDCSLREAIIAANTNAASDACPAGSASNTDVVELVAGETYLLTLPEPGDLADIDPDGGDLNVLDDTPGLDVFLRSSTTGVAAVIDQTVASQRVIRSSGSLRLLDLEIRSGSSLDCGGGVLVDAARVLDVQHAIFRGNRSLNGGAVCMLSTGSTATISDSLFVENAASSANGGALFNKGATTVTGSAFVRNEAVSGSGAHNQPGGTLQITGSCFTDNVGVAFSNSSATQQSGTGNWWAASSGPSGEGTGGGDAVGAHVDFSGFATSVPDACRPLPLQRNGGFDLSELGADPGQPDDWKLARVDVAVEGRRCGVDGGCVLRLDGAGKPKTVKQVVRIAGSAGDRLTLRARSRAKDVPATAAPYRVRAIVVHADGSRQIKSLPFSAGTHDFEVKAKTFVVSEDFRKVQIEIAYGRASGTARFDDVSLTIEP